MELGTDMIKTFTPKRGISRYFKKYLRIIKIKKIWKIN